MGWYQGYSPSIEYANSEYDTNQQYVVNVCCCLRLGVNKFLPVPGIPGGPKHYSNRLQIYLLRTTFSETV